MPEHRSSGGRLVSEIEDLSSFGEASFLVTWRCVSRAWGASCDELHAPFGLPCASWALGLSGALRGAVRPPWKPKVLNLNRPLYSLGEPRTRGLDLRGRRQVVRPITLAGLRRALSVSCRGTVDARIAPRTTKSSASERLDSFGPGGSVPVALASGRDLAFLSWGIRLFSLTACAVCSLLRDVRESRERITLGWLPSWTLALLRRGGHWRASVLWALLPTLQNLVGTSKITPRSCSRKHDRTWLGSLSRLRVRSHFQ
jgi:hypothetical protein